MANEAGYKGMPFQEAIDLFRQKVNLPTERWNDLWAGMHARAFMVAGASKDELLADLRAAVDKAISDGTTLATFRKDFDQIVAQHGWSYQGGRGWRTRVIYETNLRTAYMAGRYRQMTDPAVLAARPYWEYRHGDSAHPRPMHLSWNGTVLPADHPWWQTHYTPNGWGCKCKVFALSGRDLARLGKTGPDTAPDNGTYDWVDKKTGVITQGIPRGIDPGWDYNVGQAAFGKKLADEAMDAWQAQGAKAWEPLSWGSPETYQRPAGIPLDAPQAHLGRRLNNSQEVTDALNVILGGEQKLYTVAGLPVVVHAESLARHIDPVRAEYLPLIEETLHDPFEVWLAFERHKGTGKVVLRSRIIKAFDLGKGRGVLIVANATKGLLEAWTFFPVSQLSYLDKQRRGMLLRGRE